MACRSASADDGNAHFNTCFRGNSLPLSGNAVTWPEYVEKPTIVAPAPNVSRHKYPMFHWRACAVACAKVNQ